MRAAVESVAAQVLVLNSQLVYDSTCLCSSLDLCAHVCSSPDLLVLLSQLLRPIYRITTRGGRENAEEEEELDTPSVRGFKSRVAAKSCSKTLVGFG